MEDGRKSLAVLVCLTLVAVMLLPVVSWAAQKETIVFWCWGPQKDHVEAVLPDFYREHPNIEVKVEQYSFSEVHDKLLLGLVSGVVPDVSMIEVSYLARLRAEEDLPLLDIGRGPYRASEYADDFLPSRWEMVTLETGEVVGLPIDVGPVVTFYRRSAFDNVGMPSAPELLGKQLATWDDFTVVGRKMARDVDGDGLQDRWLIADAATLWDARREQTGLASIGRDGSVNIDSEAWIKALSYAVDFRQRGYDATSNFGWGTGEYWDGIARGAIATEIRGSWFGGAIVGRGGAGDWGILAPPGGVGANQGGSFVVIPEASAHKDTAWAFIEYVFASAKSQALMLELIDYFPSFIPAYSEPIFEEPVPFYGDQAVRLVMAEVAMKTPPVFVHPRHNDAMSRVKAYVRRALDGEISPEAALQSAAEEVRGLLAETSGN